MSLSLCKKRRTQEEVPCTSKRSRSEIASSQTELSSSQLASVSAAAIRCGKIIKIHLINFMCHSNLTIDFHKRVNFLVGSNGSGKSAIIAALVLGLGAKAKATNRSSSMKQFIKTGETSAKIEISLSNEGAEAFESQVYGDRITVVRSITQTGASYVIKNERGTVISRKVDDLHRILMYHNVQVENPVFVLNQDSAREFLKELEPSKNYKLFLKATQIEMVMEKLSDCLHSYKDMQRRMQCYKMTISKNKKEIQELKERYAQLLSVEQIKNVLSGKKIERVWLLVTQLEMELAEFIEEMEKKERKKQKLMRFAHNRGDVEKELKQKIKDLDQEIAEKNSSIGNDNTAYMQMKTEYNKMNDKCAEINSFIQSYKSRKSFLEDQIKELHNHIEDRSKNNMGEIAEIRRRNETTIIELKKTKENNDAMIDTTKRDLKIFLDNKVQTDEKINDVKRQRSSVDEDIRILQAQISNVKASSKDKLSIYGADMSHLIGEVEKLYQAGKFTERPRGPIGSYIEVPNSKYRNVVENQVGGLLKAFIVSCTKDRHTLEGIIKNKFPNFNPIIITTKFMPQVYDVRNGSVVPPRGTRLLMNEIRCSDPVVMNCLIDRLQIETIILAEDKNIAENVTSNMENVPRHLSRVIVPQHGLEYYPEPNYRMYTMKINPARFIQVNVTDRIKQLEQEKIECQQRCRQLENLLSEFGPQLKENSKRIQEKRTILEKYESKKRELLEKINELENYEYPEYNEVDILKKELAENQRKLEEIDHKISEKKIEFAEARNTKENYEQQMRSLKNVLHSIEEEIERLKNDSEEERRKLRSLANNFKENQDKMKAIDEELQELQQEKESKLSLLAEKTEAASRLGERVATENTTENLQEEIKKLEAKLKHSSKINENPVELSEHIKAKEHTLKGDLSNYDSLKFSIELLNQSRHKRYDVIKKLKQHMVLLLQFSFDHITKLRQFVGSIEVDHHERTLDVSVVPRDGHLQNAVSSTRALSGGERSYSTIAFLISLWACVDHPFYFLDEYDVFTDEVNREFMTRLLINEGKKKPNRQYAFLTPQDMSITSRDFVKIHKFAVPERR